MGTFAFLLSASYLLAGVFAVPRPHVQSKSCDTPEEGYQCFSNVSHMWGQYSPYYSLDKELAKSNEVPDDCEVTFVQVLSRHGARYPTKKKSTAYKKLVTAIQANATEFKGKYKFLQTYEYTLGSDDLTAFGEQQMVNSGIGFYERYKSLARKVVPFVRAAGSDRVILSGERFIEGFQKTKQEDSKAQKQDAPVISVIITEGETFNNTLDHGICTKFEEDESSDEIVDSFVALYATSIIARLEKDLPGVKLADDDIVSLMDMCPFDTVARTAGGSELSPFCNLFTTKEWENYNYKLSLDKYYGYGAGHPLGPEQGIGFANELIARMTQTPVQDHTSVNTTLDSNPATFPLNYTMYADFSHDNTMVSIYFALGLYEKTEPLSKTSVQTIKQTNGFSSAWVAPFAARSYFEKMQCKGEKQPLVRALVNDRVVPLNGCGADEYGRCKLDAFVESLSFARSGGNWDQCFA